MHDNGSGMIRIKQPRKVVANPFNVWANRYLREGWALIEIRSVRLVEGVAVCSCAQGADCPSLYKHPRTRFAKGKPITTQEEVDRIWPPTIRADRVWNQPNIGIVTGPASGGLVAIDLDEKPAEGKHGIRNYQMLAKCNGGHVMTRTATTASGGVHILYYDKSGRLKSTVGKVDRVTIKVTGLDDAIDTRGSNNGFIVAAPSFIPKYGRCYAWDAEPWDTTPIAPLPEWILVVLASRVGAYEVAQLKKRTQQEMKRLPGLQALTGETTRYSDPTQHEAAQTLKALLKHPLTKWALNFPNSVKREVWRGLATNLIAACSGYDTVLEVARAAFHQLSEGYDRYSPAECDRVFSEAAASGPMLFATMIRSDAPEDKCKGGVNLVDAARRAARNLPDTRKRKEIPPSLKDGAPRVR